MKRDTYLYLLKALALQDRHSSAASAADALAARWREDITTQYGCACVFALAAKTVKSDAKLADHYASSAVALLQKVIEAGYNDSDSLEKDPDLDALRGREDFKKLIKK